MKKLPPRLRLFLQIVITLLFVLLPAGCQRPQPLSRRTQLGLPNGPVLRVSGLKDAPTDLLVWMADPGETNYTPPAYGGLPDTHPYMIARGPDKGGAHLMCEGGKQVKKFLIPRAEIKAIVRMRYDMDVVDWTDVVITTNKVILVHTDYCNAGLFLPSEVYVFPRFRNCFDYLNVMQTPAWKFYDVKLLYPALLFYESSLHRSQMN